MSEDVAALLRKEISIILNIDLNQITDQTPLSQMGLDSMSFVELLVFIEKRFNINLMASGLQKEDFHTIAALAARIGRDSHN